ncbi:MAG: FtsX-like permease family protein [Planctomycetota bacterium]
MFSLAWANLMHHKLRTVLSALAVGIGIMLLLVSRGLANGSIAEVDGRMQSVAAELVVLPPGENFVFQNFAPFRGSHERLLRELADQSGPLASDVIPIYFEQVLLGGQTQRVFGIDPAQSEAFLGGRRMVAGKMFARAPLFAQRVAESAPPPAADESAYDAYLADGLEVVIDDRLQRVGGYKLGQDMPLLGRSFRLVGVVEAGVAGRVFMPIHVLRELEALGRPHATMYFVRLRPGLDAAVAADRYQRELGSDGRVELKGEYGRLLRQSLASVSLYMNASSGVALAACFLFILLTMYTLVVERTREIGILKSLGVTRLGLVRLSVTEALLIALGGVAIGVTLAHGIRVVLAILRPLLTVDLPLTELGLAVLIGVVGGTLSALYPGYRAARLDPAAALTNE